MLQNEKHTNTFEIKVFFEEIRDFGVCTIKSKFNIISKYNHLRHPDFIEIIYRELLKAKLIEEIRISYSCCRANINYDPFSFVIFEKMIMLPERMRNRPKSEIIRKIKRGIIKSQHENKHVQFHINIEKSNIELVNDILSDAIPDPRKKITISVPIEEIYKMGPSYTKLLDMEGFLTSICENI